MAEEYFASDSIDVKSMRAVVRDQVPVHARAAGVLDVEREKRKGSPELDQRWMFWVGPEITPFEIRIAGEQMDRFVNGRRFLQKAANSNETKKDNKK